MKGRQVTVKVMPGRGVATHGRTNSLTGQSEVIQKLWGHLT